MKLERCIDLGYENSNENQVRKLIIASEKKTIKIDIDWR